MRYVAIRIVETVVALEPNRAHTGLRQAWHRVCFHPKEIFKEVVGMLSFDTQPRASQVILDIFVYPCRVICSPINEVSTSVEAACIRGGVLLREIEMIAVGRYAYML